MRIPNPFSSTSSQRKLLHNGFFAFADQAVVSAASFVTGLMLIRLTPASEYGAYVLAASAIGVICQAQSAALLGPVMVLGAPQDDEQFSHFASGIGFVQVGLAGLAMLLGVALAASMRVLGVAEHVRGAFLGASLFVFWALMQAYVRRVLIARRQAGRALVNDLVFCVLQVAGLSLLAAGSGWLTGRHALFCAAVAGAVATLVGLLQVRRYLTLRPGRVFGSLKDSWNLGRWTLASSFLSRASTQVIYLVLGAMAGEAAVASLEGPRLIIAPCLLAIMGWSNSVCPEASTRFAERGPRAMVRFVLGAAVPLLAGIGVFVPVCCVAARPLLSWVLGEAYAGQTWVLAIWGMTLLMMALSTVFSMIIYLARRPQLIPVCTLASAGAGLLACPVLVSVWGPRGAAATTLIIEGAAAVLTAVFAYRVVRPAAARIEVPTILEAAA